MPKKPSVRTIMDIQHMLKGPRHWLNFHSSIIVIVYLTLSKKISSNMSALVISQILRLFVNILTRVTSILSQ